MIKSLFHKLRNQAVRRYEWIILGMLEPSDRRVRLLDCGCYDGKWTERLGAEFPDAELYGIEIDKDAVQQAAARNIQVSNADLNERFPYDNDFFDVVHANQVIEHLCDTDSFVREVYRVLCPGGYAIVCTENLGSWHNILALVLGWQPFSLSNICERKFQIGNPLAIHGGEEARIAKGMQHMRIFAYRGLRDVFVEYGFVAESCKGSGYYPLPTWVSALDVRHSAFLILKVRKPHQTS